jgi:hypothetical protein
MELSVVLLKTKEVNDDSRSGEIMQEVMIGESCPSVVALVSALTHSLVK